MADEEKVVVGKIELKVRDKVDDGSEPSLDQQFVDLVAKEIDIAYRRGFVDGFNTAIGDEAKMDKDQAELLKRAGEVKKESGKKLKEVASGS